MLIKDKNRARGFIFGFLILLLGSFVSAAESYMKDWVYGNLLTAEINKEMNTKKSDMGGFSYNEKEHAVYGIKSVPNGKKFKNYVAISELGEKPGDYSFTAGKEAISGFEGKVGPAAFDKNGVLWIADREGNISKLELKKFNGKAVPMNISVDKSVNSWGYANHENLKEERLYFLQGDMVRYFTLGEGELKGPFDLLKVDQELKNIDYVFVNNNILYIYPRGSKVLYKVALNSKGEIALLSTIEIGDNKIYEIGDFIRNTIGEDVMGGETATTNLGSNLGSSGSSTFTTTNFNLTTSTGGIATNLHKFNKDDLKKGYLVQDDNNGNIIIGDYDLSTSTPTISTKTINLGSGANYNGFGMSPTDDLIYGIKTVTSNSGSKPTNYYLIAIGSNGVGGYTVAVAKTPFMTVDNGTIIYVADFDATGNMYITGYNGITPVYKVPVTLGTVGTVQSLGTVNSSNFADWAYAEVGAEKRLYYIDGSNVRYYIIGAGGLTSGTSRSFSGDGSSGLVVGAFMENTGSTFNIYYYRSSTTKIQKVDLSQNTLVSTTYATGVTSTVRGDAARKYSVAVANIEISKTVDKTSAVRGDTLTYTINVKNNGTDSVSNITVTDTLSDTVANLFSSYTIKKDSSSGALVCSISSTNTITNGTSSNGCTLDTPKTTITIAPTLTLAGGASQTYVITGTIKSDLGSGITVIENQAFATPAGFPTANSIQVSTKIVNIGITKSVTAPSLLNGQSVPGVAPGGTVRYEMKLSNTGGGASSNTTVKDLLPNIFSSATVKVIGGGTPVINTTTGSSFATPFASTPTTAVAITPLPTDAAGIVTAAATLTRTSGTDKLTLSISGISVPVGSNQVTVVIEGVVATGATAGTYENVAVANDTLNTCDINQAPLCAPVSVTKETITKTAGTPVYDERLGTVKIPYTISFKNENAVPLSSLTLTDIFTPGLASLGTISNIVVTNGTAEIVSAVPTGKVTGISAAVGATWTMTFDLTVPYANIPANKEIDNTATLKDVNDGVLGTATAVATLNKPALTYTKTVSDGADNVASPGELITYTITISNSSTSPATDVTFVDNINNVKNSAGNGLLDIATLSTTVDPKVTTTSGTVNLAAGIVTVSGISVPGATTVGATTTPGTVTITIPVKVLPSYPVGTKGGEIIGNNVTISGITPPDCTLTDNASKCGPVTVPLSETITKTAGTPVYDEGLSTVTIPYEIKFTNNNAVALSNLTLTDTFTPLLSNLGTISNIVVTNGTAEIVSTKPTGTVTGISAAIGAEWKMTFNLTVPYVNIPGLTDGKIDNKAVLTTSDSIKLGEATAQVILTKPILTYTKIVDQGTNNSAEPGEQLTYTIVISNDTASAATDVTFEDDLNNIKNSAGNGIIDIATVTTSGVTTTSGNVGVSSGKVTVSGITVPAKVGSTKGQVTITIKANVKNPYPEGTKGGEIILNNIIITGITPADCTIGNSDTSYDENKCGPVTISLSETITKTAGTPVYDEGLSTVTIPYEIKFKNNNAVALSDLILVDTFTPSLSSLGTISDISVTSGTAEQSSGKYTGKVTEISAAVGTEWKMKFNLTVPYGSIPVSGKVDNTAILTTSGGTELGRATAQVTFVKPSLSYTKTATDSTGDGVISSGELIEYKIVISNTSVSPATDVTFEDNLNSVKNSADNAVLDIDSLSTTIDPKVTSTSGEVSIVSGVVTVSGITVPGGTVASPGIVTITIPVKALTPYPMGTKGGEVIYNNITKLSGVTPPTSCSVDTVAQCGPVTIELSEAITKTAGTPIYNQGLGTATIPYEIKFTNNNAVALSDLILVDTFTPSLSSLGTISGISVTSGTAEQSSNKYTGKVTGISAAVGAEWKMTFNLTVPYTNILSTGTRIDNTAVLTTSGGKELGRATASAILTKPSLNYTKTAVGTGGTEDKVISPGELVEYTIVISNTTASPATDVTFADNLNNVKNSAGNAVLDIDSLSTTIDPKVTSTSGEVSIVSGVVTVSGITVPGGTVASPGIVTITIPVKSLTPYPAGTKGGEVIYNNITKLSGVTPPESCSVTTEQQCGPITTAVTAEITKTVGIAVYNQGTATVKVPYEIKFTNNNAVKLTNLKLTDTFVPTLLDLTGVISNVQLTITGSGDGAAGTPNSTNDEISGISLDVGQTWTMTFDLIVPFGIIPDGGKTIDNTAILTSGQVELGRGTAQTTLTKPLLSYTKVAADKGVAPDNLGAGNGVISPGELIEYTVVISNGSTSAATDVTFEDDLSKVLNSANNPILETSTLTTSSITSTSGTVAITGGKVTISGITVPGATTVPGQVTIKILVNAKKPYPEGTKGGEVIYNNVTISGITPPTCSVGTDEQCGPVTIALSETITKTAGTPIYNQGLGTATIPYEIKFTNNNAVDLSNLTLTDTFAPALSSLGTISNVVVTNGTAEIVSGNPTGKVTGISAAVNAEWKMTFDLTVPYENILGDGKVKNTAILKTSNEIELGRAEAETVIVKPLLNYTKRASDKSLDGIGVGDGVISPGELIEYKIIISNTTASPATDVTFADNLNNVKNSAGNAVLDINSLSTTIDPKVVSTSGTVGIVSGVVTVSGIIVPGGTVANPGTVTITIPVKALTPYPEGTKGGEIIYNNVTVSGITPPTCSVGTVEQCGPITIAPSEKITKTAGTPVYDQELGIATVPYTISFTNNNIVKLDTLKLIDVFTPTLSSLGGTISNVQQTITGSGTGAAGTANGTNDEISGISLDLGQTWTMTFDLMIPYDKIPEDGKVKNTATLRDINGRILGSADAEVILSKPVLTYTKTADQGINNTAEPGEQLTYTIVISNSSSSPATDVTFVDDLTKVVNSANKGMLDLSASVFNSSSITSPAGSSVDINAGKVTVTKITVPGANGSTPGTATITIKVNMLSSYPEGTIGGEVIYNGVTISGITPPTCPVDTVEQCGPITIPLSETVSKVAGTPVYDQELAKVKIPYTISFTNNNAVKLTDLKLTDTFVPTLSDLAGVISNIQQTITGSGTGAAGTANGTNDEISGINLDLGQTWTMTFDLTIPYNKIPIGGKIDNTAVLATSSGTELGRATAETTLLLPALTYTKVVDQGTDNLASPGEQLIYTIVISNSSSSPATDVTFVDDLTKVVNSANKGMLDLSASVFNSSSITSPAGSSVDINAGKVTVTKITVPGASGSTPGTATITIKVNMLSSYPAETKGGEIIYNNVTISGITPPTCSVNTVAQCGPIIIPASETLTKVAGTPTYNETGGKAVIPYTVSFTNNNQIDLNGLTLEDIFTPGLSIVGTISNIAVTNGTTEIISGNPTGKVTGISAAVGATWTMKFNLEVLFAEIPADGNVSNTAILTDSTGRELGRAVENVKLTKPELSFTKTAASSSNQVGNGGNPLINPGDTVTYTVVISNAADVPASGVTFTDNLNNVVNEKGEGILDLSSITASSVTVVSSAGAGVTGTTTVENGVVNVTGIEIPKNGTVTITITVPVKKAFPSTTIGGETIYNGVTITGIIPPVCSVDTATQCGPVVTPAAKSLILRNDVFTDTEITYLNNGDLSFLPDITVKNSNPPVVAAGDYVYYFLTLTNENQVAVVPDQSIDTIFTDYAALKDSTGINPAFTEFVFEGVLLRNDITNTYTFWNTSSIPALEGDLGGSGIPGTILTTDTVDLTVVPPNSTLVFAVRAKLNPGGIFNPGDQIENFASLQNDNPKAYGELRRTVIIPEAIPGDLIIVKSTEKETVSVGEFVPYTIEITNKNNNPVSNVYIEDKIPSGFIFVEGSARAYFTDNSEIEILGNGNGIPIPTTGQKTIKMGPLTIPAKAEKVRVTYLMKVGVGVTTGIYKNIAVVKNGGGTPISNVSEADVRVVPDALFDQTVIIGKVFFDKNENGMQDEELGEYGIPGVRVATIDGINAITDAYGRFHIPEVTDEHGKNFIIKVDASTLPQGSEFTTENPLVRRLGKVMLRYNFGVKLPEPKVVKKGTALEVVVKHEMFKKNSNEFKDSKKVLNLVLGKLNSGTEKYNKIVLKPGSKEVNGEKLILLSELLKEHSDTPVIFE